MRNLCAGAALITALAGSAAAQDNTVRLEALAGDATVVGELVGFDDGTYTLRTVFGVLQIPAESVLCTGEACPRVGPAQLTLAVANADLAEALDALLRDFAAVRGAEVVAGEAPGAGRRLYLRQQDETVAEITLQQVEGLSTLRPAAGAEPGYDLALVAQPVDSMGRDTVLGSDAVVALVHPDNPVAALSPAELAGVLDGSIADWSQLGGAEGAIDLVMPPPGSLAGGAVAAALGRAGPEGAEAVAPAGIPGRVAQTPAALGLTLWSARGAGGRALALVGPCGALVPADAFAIGSGLYPLRADIAIRFSNKDLPEIAEEFAGYLASGAARADLAEAGVPTQPPVVALPVGQQGDHLARSLADAGNDAELEQLQVLFADLVDARQLSTVYRFGSNAVRSEPEHARVTAALADYLADLDPERTGIFLQGYSDELETRRRRVGLSRARAEQVRNLIAEAAPAFSAVIRTAGFEDLAPRGCNREAAGRSLNRRVEVWIRSRS